jgi:hypothetical protein
MSEEDFDYSKYLTPPAAPEPAEPEPDYGAMPWKEVAYQGAKNLLPSAKNALMAIPEAVVNYEQTGQALKQLGTGIASKVKGAVGVDQDAEQKAHDEALLNAIAEPYTSVAGLKKALATDPFSVLSTAAIPLTMGASGAESAAATLGKIGQTGSKAAQYAAKAAELTGKGLEATSYAFDPVKSAIGLTGAVADYGGQAIKHGVAGASNAPSYSLEKAFAAGAERGPNADAIKNAFNDFATGAGDPVEFSQRAAKAVDAIKNEASADWKAKKGAMLAANGVEPDWKPIFQAIDDGRDSIGRNVYPSNATTHALLDEIEKEATARMYTPTGSIERSIEGMDAWKRLLQQQINQMAQTAGVDKQALQGVHAGIKESINKVAPEYQELMDHWSAVKDNLQNIASLGTSSKTAANNELARFIKAQKTPQGQQLIEQLAEKDPLLPYMVSGATLHSAGAGGISGLVEKGSAPWHVYNIGSNLISGDWKGLLGATGLAAAQGTIQSPRVMGQTAYALGSLAGSPVGRATGAITSSIPTFARANPAVMNLNRAQDESFDYSKYLNQPPAFATGGTVLDHETEADKLVRAAERAKNEVNKTTEPLLNVDDNTIARALDVAQAAI